MDTKPIKVLLIEDDEDDYCLVRDILSDIKGWQYDLEWVNTYEAGLEAICRNEHDVCLLDYRLGESTGLNLLREIDRNSCTIPVILLTGEGGHDVDVEAMNAGAADFLVKGQIDAYGLERSVRYAITRRRAEEELKESECKFRTLYDSTSDAVMLLNEEGFLDCNLATLKVFGCDSREEFCGKHPADLSPPTQPCGTESLALAKGA